jgi:hypothetical protein
VDLEAEAGKHAVEGWNDLLVADLGACWGDAGIDAPLGGRCRIAWGPRGCPLLLLPYRTCDRLHPISTPRSFVPPDLDTRQHQNHGEQR